MPGGNIRPPPPEFSSDYAQSVAILVALTGVAPFVLTQLLLRALKLRGLAASIAGLVSGLVFCVAGYAVFWLLFIGPSGVGAPAMMDVAARGVGWGLLLGGLASLVAGHLRSNA
jgi:hypothetical protein